MGEVARCCKPGGRARKAHAQGTGFASRALIALSMACEEQVSVSMGFAPDSENTDTTPLTAHLWEMLRMAAFSQHLILPLFQPSDCACKR